MAIKKGDKIKVDYEGKLQDGTVFDSSKHGDHSHPLEFVVGDGNIIKGFDDGVIGMEIGQEKTLTIEPEQAYGKSLPELVQKVPKDQMPEGNIEKGMALMMQLPTGEQIPAAVIDVTDTEVTLDLNHPLSGKTLTFEIKVIAIN